MYAMEIDALEWIEGKTNGTRVLRRVYATLLFLLLKKKKQKNIWYHEIC